MEHKVKNCVIQEVIGQQAIAPPNPDWDEHVNTRIETGAQLRY
jgi:hypothetical protein